MVKLKEFEIKDSNGVCFKAGDIVEYHAIKNREPVILVIKFNNKSARWEMFEEANNCFYVTVFEASQGKSFIKGNKFLENRFSETNTK